MKEKLRSEFLDRQNMVNLDYELYYYNDTGLRNVKPHKHGYFEFLFFLSGDVTTIIDGQSIHLQPGDVTIIPPGVFHYSNIQNTKEYTRYTFWISEEFFDFLKHSSAVYAWLADYVRQNKTYVFHFDRLVFQELQNDLIRLLENRNREGFGSQAYSRLLCAGLILNISRAVHAQVHPEKPREGQSLYDNLLGYIQTHLEEDLSLDNLAQRFFVSKYYISHLFKDNMGLSLHQYVIKKRLERIRVLLMQDADIMTACEEMGFKNYSSFYRAFVKEYGMSPKDYRKAHKLEAEEQA